MKPAMFAALSGLLMLATLPAAGQATFVTVGTGGITGVYYPTGGAVCRQVNQHRQVHGLRCSVESTDGSLFNLRAIRAGDLDLGLAQSDWQFHAWRGTGAFEVDGPFPELRALFSLHAEPLTVLARADSGIHGLSDLRGRRLNIGNRGSGQRATTLVLLQALGWQAPDFASLLELASIEQAAALCAGRIDALAFSVGHPNGSIKEATSTCDARLVPVAGPVVDTLVAEHPYYSPQPVPGGLYRGNEADVPSFGVVATLVTSTRLPEDSAYAIVKAVFDDLPAFRALHPALAPLQPQTMIHDGISAPLHDGAVRYYKERGLM